MKLFIYLIKRTLTNPYLLFWSIAFVTFFIVMGAFLESKSIPDVEEARQIYVSTWFGVVILLSFSASSVTTSSIVSYHTGGLPHLFRFSRMTPLYFVVSIVLSNLVVIGVIGAYMLIAVYGMFSYAFSSPFPPNDLIMCILTIFLSGLFFSSMSLFLGILSSKLNRGMSRFVDFLPLILGYLFGYAYLYVNFGSLVYVSPFNSIELLGESAYSGKGAPLDFAKASVQIAMNNNNYVQASDLLMSLSLLVWFMLIVIADVFLVRRLYLNPLEEGKVA
ncbi:hypothetical protein [Sulfuracidifex metallicus]|uniref:ABC transporter permease n=1 Tax=Sulfuracidifex metallicus DSM 6482 = JCM 9184 TaxID=523847 RepID=A0A6A9QQ18_SULME|nr:hypothetical protein [Sulfuracidifex metallicus]MUN27903.1 hypothetical protein [Sulfuracidifex metallicus DSM 6482 = JCM 9184]